MTKTFLRILSPSCSPYTENNQEIFGHGKDRWSETRSGPEAGDNEPANLGTSG